MWLSFSAALLIILGFLAYFIPRQVEGNLERLLYNRAQDVAREIEQRFPPAALPTPVDVRQAARLKVQARGVDRAAVLLDRPGPEGPVILALHADPEDVASLVRSIDWRAPPDRLLQADGDVVAIHLVARPGEPKGYILVQVDGVPEVLQSVRLTVALSFGIGFLLLAVISWYLSRNFIVRPLQGMMLAASRISEADLTGRVEVTRADELGQLAEALNRIGQSLRETLGRVRGVSEGVAHVIEQISRTGHTVFSGASTIQERVEETSTSMGEMLTSLRGIGGNIEVLYQSAEESSASILEMASTNEEVAENVQAMATSVEETISAIEQLTFSIKDVARNVEALHASSEETSTSMNKMNVSIDQVGMNANETAKLSEQVTQDAKRGVEALQKTLAGIDKIKESSRTASTVIESLGRRIQEIGNILNVIDDVAEETNLLALNAAIIAAQAGEHGKGFAVVAEEIKDLAERTGASTREIAELVRGVQDESRNAVAVMNQGVRNVEEGVQLGRDAEGALKKIHDSANKATVMVKAIARATVEQARGSRQVTGAIQRIAETVQQISTATNEQALGCEQLTRSSEKMNLLASRVQRSSQAQARGSRQITRAIESISEMVGHLNRAQKEQTVGSEQVLGAMQAIQTVSEHQTRSVRQLEEAIDALTRQAEVLRNEVRRFRV